MASKKQPTKRKVSYASTSVSITLVLFLVGIFGLLVFHANQLKDYMKENVQVSIYFVENMREPDIKRIESRLEERPSIDRIKYVSEEEAKELMKKNLGEDAVEVLGYNPYPASLDVYFKADYAHSDTLEQFQSEWEGKPDVREVQYQKALVQNIDKNVRIAGAIVLGLAIIFLIIAIVLINSTIRLSLFAKRFLIKSMQLVGATRWFIRKPFILRSLLHGLIGGIVATLLLMGMLYFAQEQFPFVNVWKGFSFYLMLFPGLILMGVIITGFSSLFAVNKYLKMKLDDLY